MLAALQAGEFIYEQPAASGVEYTFKHALTQEVAYNSLLIERRKLLHERAAQAIESMFAGHLDDHLTDLAHHYSNSDNVSKAVEYLGRAGQQAMQRSLHADAISNLSAAIDLLQQLPESQDRNQRELFLQLAVGPALIAVNGQAAPEAERVYIRARQLCERLGDPPELFPVLVGLWIVHLVRAELRTAREIAERLLQRTHSAHDPPELSLYAHMTIGETSMWLGELLLTREHLEMAISLYDRERHRALSARYKGVDAAVNSLSLLADTLWLLGYPDQALKRVNEGVALAQALSHAHSLAQAELGLFVLHQFRRETLAAQKIAERVIELSTEHGFTDFLAWATAVRGWAMAKQGHNEGVALIQESLAAIRTTGNELSRPYFLTLLAEACINAGRLDDAFGLLTPTLGADMHRLKGEVLLSQDDSNASKAQSCFERAIQIARAHSAKSLELRATISLACLLEKQGHREEARAMLAEIYRWFTEGFDTADLKDAKALLDKLGG